MQIDEITSNLEERGFWWQASGFGLIGAVTLTVLSVYSDSNLWIIDSYRMAVTQLQWTPRRTDRSNTRKDQNVVRKEKRNPQSRT